MVNEYVNVIEVVDGCVIGNSLFVGEHADIVKAAERHFIERCKENKLAFNDDDEELSLEDGYFVYGNWCVCIAWPEITWTNIRK